jgi:hypothetical protein
MRDPACHDLIMARFKLLDETMCQDNVKEQHTG